MGFFDWLNSVFGSGETYTSISDDTPNVTRGRPGRRELLDERLLPKEEDSKRSWWEPRPKVMDKAETDRLFSDSMRTSRSGQAAILADEKQLARLGLPVWETETDLAEALGLSVKRLHYFACHRLDDEVCHYVTYRIPKRSGGVRTIMAPKRELRELQRTVLRELAEKLPVSAYAHGFLKGRSVRTNAEPHVGKKIVIGMDLADFFGSVTFARVRGLLITYGFGYQVATSLALLMTEAERQPVDIDGQTHYVPVSRRYCVQGAPTSPAVSNALTMKLDHRLAGLAESFGYAYTRYADDLSFSGDDDTAVGPLLSVTGEIVADEGFALNDAKTRVMHAGRHQEVTGVTVNETLGLTRKKRRKIRAMIHRLNRERDAGTLDPADVAELEGKLAWVEMLDADQAAALRRDWGGAGEPATNVQW